MQTPAMLNLFGKGGKAASSEKYKEVNQDFSALNVEVKVSRKLLLDLKNRCQGFQDISREFFNRLNEVQQAVTKVAMDKECSDILGTEFVQEFVGMQGTVIGQLNGMLEDTTESLIQLAAIMEPKVESVKDRKQEMKRLLAERNALATRIYAACSSKKPQAMSRIVKLRMDHLQAAGLFARGQEATLCAMTDFETGLALEMSSRICKTVRVYHSSLTRAMSLTDRLSQQVLTAEARLGDFAERHEAAKARRSETRLDLERMVLDRLGPNALSGKDVNDRSEGVSMIGLCVTDVDQPSLTTSLLKGETAVHTLSPVRNLVTHRFGVLQITDYRVKFTPYPLKFRLSFSGEEGVVRVPVPEVPSRSSLSEGVGSSGGEGVASAVHGPAGEPDRSSRASSAPRSTSMSFSDSFPSSGWNADAEFDAVLPDSSLCDIGDAVVSLPLSSIARVEYSSEATTQLHFHCHNMRCLSVDFSWLPSSPLSAEGIQSFVMSSLDKPPGDPKPFLYRYLAAEAPPPPEINGWRIYDMNVELRRMVEGTKWYRVSAVNASYQMCATYPCQLVFPVHITDAEINEAAQFRAKKRLPAITWCYKSVNLSRSSQPMSGLLNSRSEHDELLVLSLIPKSDGEAAASGPTSSSQRDKVTSRQLYICDARPKLNAMTNKGKGGGSENMNKYTSCRLEFLGIDNIHVVREAFAALRASVLEQCTKVLHLSYESPSVSMGPASVPLPLETRSRSKTASHAGTGGSSAIMAESRRRPSMLRSIVPPLAEKGALSRSFAPARESGEEEFIPRAPSRAPPSLPPHALPAGALAPPTFHPELPSLLIRSSAGEAGTLTSDPPLLTRTGIPSDTSASGRLNECALPQLSGTNTEWYKLISTILDGGIRISQLLISEISVLVHCSDGWDRTAQLSAIAQILIDPYYRTLYGFSVLVEKEWCHFGHQFARRCGTGPPRANFQDTQRSPVFLQFVDCIFQIWRQFPSRFEFNERFLEALAIHVYTGRFGTFVGNNEKERIEAGIPDNTVSLWSYILSRPAEFTNPGYIRPPGRLGPDNPSMDPMVMVRHVIKPTAALSEMKVWRFYVQLWDGVL